MLASVTLRAPWRMCLALVMLAAVPPSDIARAEAIVAGARASGPADAATGAGVLRHLRALQDIATANGGNRAAGTPGYDRSAEYVAARLREAGYVVRFEEFEFPSFEERTPPVLIVSTSDGRQEPAPASALRTLANSGSGKVAAPLRAVNLDLGAEPPPA